MNWLAILKLVLVLADRVARIVETRGLITAGEDRALARSLKAIAERLGIARQIAAETTGLSNEALDRELAGDDL
jgi:hypothetical protein